MLKIISHLLRRIAKTHLSLPIDDALLLGGIGLVAAGAALERLSAGLIVAGLLVLVLAIGGTRAR